MREKLIELLNKSFDEQYSKRGLLTAPHTADHLIAHGVTVQEWISVKDERKPNHGDIALCYMTFGEYRLLQWGERSKLWFGDYMDYRFEDVAYWQIPHPPKGE